MSYTKQLAGLSLNKPPMLEHSNIKKQPNSPQRITKALQGRRTRASRPSTDTQLSGVQPLRG